MKTEEKEYTLIEINEYLLTDKIKNLSQEIKDEITIVRGTLEYMKFDIYKELISLGVLEKVVKLKHPRTTYVRGDEVIYFNSRNERFEICAKFKNNDDETV